MDFTAGGHQVPVVKLGVDNFIQRISRYPVNKRYWLESREDEVGVHFIGWIAIYPLDEVVHSLNNRLKTYKNRGRTFGQRS